MGYGKTRLACPKDTFKVLYIAPAPLTAIAETVIRDRFVDRARRRIFQEELEAWGAGEVETTRPLRLIDLRGLGLTLLGVPTDALGARNQRAGRRMSAELYYQHPNLDGVIYTSRHVKRDCVAVYDRGVPKLSAGPVVGLVTLPALLPALIALNVSLVPRG